MARTRSSLLVVALAALLLFGSLLPISTLSGTSVSASQGGASPPPPASAVPRISVASAGAPSGPSSAAPAPSAAPTPSLSPVRASPSVGMGDVASPGQSSEQSAGRAATPTSGEGGSVTSSHPQPACAASTYPIVFNQTGIPSNVQWDVEVNGSIQYPYGTTASVTFCEPNGVVDYTVFQVSGWYQTTIPYSGSVTVAGHPINMGTMAFVQFVYPVQFLEAGLPNGTWSAVINYTTYTVPTGDPINASLPNGTFPYSILDVPGWHQASVPYSSTFSVAGTPFTLPTCVFSPVVYQVVFQESGLPANAVWAVTINTSSDFEPAPNSLSVAVTNGSQPYTLADVQGWHQSSIPYSGTFSINGGTHAIDGSYIAVSESVAFHQVLYNVTFSESGLSGERWSVTYNGSQKSATAPSSITFPSPNGTYPYTIPALSGWTASGYSGSVTTNGANPPAVPVSWTQVLYTVSFHESGLTGEKWAVTFNGSTSTRSTASTLTFQSPNGTFPFNISNVPNWRAGSYSGHVTVEGGNPGTVSVTFTLVTYIVTFTETGLTGEGWSVTLNGTSSGRTTASTINFASPNGTYPFTVANTPGWRANAYSGGVSVTGRGTGSTVAWTQVTYAVTFGENGLSAAGWAVTFNGSTSTRGTGPTITFVSPNGSYRYNLSNVPGWRTSVYAGTVTVSGAAPPTVVSTWTRVTYSGTFSESGLPSGTTWSVTVNGSLFSTASSSIRVDQLANGSYPYTVGRVSGYQANPSSGTLQVNGGSATAPAIDFTAIPPNSYPVGFNETGLPSGATWSVTIGGVPYSATAGSAITAYLTNATYPYEISDVAGWHQATLPYAGSVRVQGGPVNEPIMIFTQVLYAVTFTESGLPGGKVWAVTINGTLFGANAPGAITTSLPNGTFSYLVGNLPGWHQSSLPYLGRGQVSGQSISMTSLQFTQVLYAVTFTESGLPSGSWSVRINGTLVSDPVGSPIVLSLPNGSFTYAISDYPGYHQTTLAYSGSGTIGGAPVSPATLRFFAVTYTVSFEESGVQGGAVWTTELDALPRDGTGTWINFTGVANGTHTFQANASGYRASPSFGSLTVQGSGTTQSIVFTIVLPSTYTVTFTESGLPAGSPWTVVFGNGNRTAMAPTPIAFSSTLNGTYPFSVRSAGYAANPSNGFLTVNGSSIVEPVGFTFLPPGTYTVTFQESGLRLGAWWTISVEGTPQSGSGGSIEFVGLINGTYAFTTNATGYVATPSSGSVAIFGSNATINITFRVPTYAVEFTETGLPFGTRWNLTVGSNEVSSPNATVFVQLANGSYSFVVPLVGPWDPVTNGSGRVVVTGPGVGAEVVFVFTTPVTFAQQGLNETQSWWVNLTNTVLGTSRLVNATGAQVTVLLVNGSYRYTIIPPSGYLVMNATGAFTADGTPIAQSATFTNSGPSGGTSPIPLWVWAAVIVALAAVALGLGWLFLSRRRRPPPAATPPP